MFFCPQFNPSTLGIKSAFVLSAFVILPGAQDLQLWRGEFGPTGPGSLSSLCLGGAGGAGGAGDLQKISVEDT